MHINEILFLVSTTKHIGLTQCMCIRKKHRDKIPEAILLMLCTYRVRGKFTVITIGTDKAFDSIKSELHDNPYQVTLTICNAYQHVEVKERMI